VTFKSAGKTGGNCVEVADAGKHNGLAPRNPLNDQLIAYRLWVRNLCLSNELDWANALTTTGFRGGSTLVAKGMFARSIRSLAA
jgi:hypothetical protein